MAKPKKKPEIVFAPGCFDNFDGTQEELDELISEIHRMVESGEIFEKATPVDIDGMLEEFTEEELAEIIKEVEDEGPNPSGKTLH